MSNPIGSAWPEGGTGQMFRLIHELPDQLAASRKLEGLDRVSLDPGLFDRVLLCGMGGSAIAGDLVQPLLTHQPKPLDVWRNYGLPHWATDRTLILVASYSGNTEESLSALAEGRRRGCPVVGVTSGGRLALAAEGEGGPAFPCVTLPGGLPPRASLGFGLGALTQVLSALGLVREAEQEIAEAESVLRRLDPGRLAPVAAAGEQGEPVEEPGMLPARALAEKLENAVPVIYTVGPEAAGAGLRLKGQFNENSKSPACLGVFPELNHNDLVGWELDDALKGRFVLLILGGKQDNIRLDTRVRVTRDLLRDDISEIHEIMPSGQRSLARVLSLVQYGDYLSCHLAQLKGVDPVPVHRIGTLKDHLARLGD